MNTNPRPQSLDALFTHAQQHAEVNLRCFGVLPVTLFLLGPQGPAVFAPPNCASESAKDAFAADARLVSIAHGATATVMSLESWANLAEPGVPLDPNQRPSQSPHRREVVTLVGETAGIHQVKFLPIRRHGNGGFAGFGEVSILPCDHIEGRFAQMLPAHPPTPEEQTRARVQLMARGIVMAGPPKPPVKARSGHRHGFSC